MQRLFKIVVEGKPEYFDNKTVAKIRRDRVANGGVLMRGPDHWKGESFNISKQTPKTERRDTR